MAIEIKQSSRLAFSDVLIIDGIEFWDLMDLPDYKPRPDDIKHNLVDGDRIDLLGQFYYQDPVLGWVILWANNIEIPSVEFQIGMVLTIPNPSFIRSRLLNGSLT